MGWTVSFLLSRPTALAHDERVALGEHVRRNNDQTWAGEAYNLDVAQGMRDDGVLAYGFMKIPYDNAANLRRVCRVMTELRALLPETTCVVGDDFNVIGWDAERQAYVPNRKPIDGRWQRIKGDDFAPAESVLPPREVRLSPALQAAIGDSTPTAPAASEQTAAATEILDLIDLIDKDDPRLAALEQVAAQLDPIVFLRAGVKRFAELRYEARRLLGEALKRLEDPTPVVADLLALWRTPGADRYLVVDSSRFISHVAWHPLILAEWCNDIWEAASTGADTNAQSQAAEEIGESHSEVAVQCLVAAERMARGQSHSWRYSAYRALSQLADKQAVPTLLLSAADPAYQSMGPAVLLRALEACKDERALPYLAYELACGQQVSLVLGALKDIPGPDAHTLIAGLTAHDDPGLRLQAATVLVERAGISELPVLLAAIESAEAEGYAPSEEGAFGTLEERALAAKTLAGDLPADPRSWPALLRSRSLQPVELPPLPDLLRRLTSNSPLTREWAIDEAKKRKNPAHILALAAAKALHDEVASANGELGRTVLFWDDWGLIPEDVMDPDEVADWAQAHPDQVGPQMLTPILQDVLDQGPQKVASRFPALRPHLFEPANRAQLEAEEAAICNAFRLPERPPRRDQAAVVGITPVRASRDVWLESLSWVQQRGLIQGEMVTSLKEPPRIGWVAVSTRTSDGTLVGYVQRPPDLLSWRYQAGFNVDLRSSLVVPQGGAAELAVTAAHEVTVLVATGHCAGWPVGVGRLCAPWPGSVQWSPPRPDGPVVQGSLCLQISDPRGQHPRRWDAAPAFRNLVVEAFVTTALRPPAADYKGWTLDLSLLDQHEDVLGKDDTRVTLVAGAPPRWTRLQVDLSREALSKVRSFRLELTGDWDRSVTLAHF